MSYYSYTFKDLTESQKLTIAYYFYFFCKNNKDFYSLANEHIKILYKKLVDSLNLKQHSEKVIQAIINQHIQSNELTKYTLLAKNNHPFSYRKQLPINFKEDDEILDNIEHNWFSRSLFDIDLIRAVFAGNENCLYKIIAYTFFIKPEKNNNFVIPDFDAVESVIKNFKIDKSCVSFLIKDFNLSKDEGDLLNLAYYCSVQINFNALMESYFDHNLDKKNYIVFYSNFFVEHNAGIIEQLLRKNKKLVSFGLFTSKGELCDDTINSIVDGTTDSLYSDVLKLDDKISYPLNSYNIKEDEINLASNLLKSNGAINLLLYGAPGAGKTEFARSLVRSLGLKPLVFKNENEVNDEKAEDKVLCKINSLLSLDKKDSVIIVDEAEGILKTQGSFFGMQYSLPQKGIVNKMLENSHNRVIWILNYTHELDESTRRRFTYAIKFNEMTPTMLKSIADTKLNAITMSENLHTEIVDLCGKYHVTGASVDNIVKTVSNMDLSTSKETQVLNDVKKVLESNSTLIFGKKKMREMVRPDYDLSVLNTTTPASEIVEMVNNAQQFAEENGTDGSGIRMLFYGLSGTGKTELARYIAEQLNKKILLKRPSDILGKYVGENEENIRRAFEQAEASGDVLLFDEADTFFADRTNLGQSWERSSVNEFLTQMEEFSGILICTTNLRQIMDPAMQRRFHILTEFKPLKTEGIRTLLGRYFGSYNFDSESIETLSKYETVTPGDFGTLSGKIKFMPKTSITSETIISELCKIQDEKESNHHSIGFAV